MACAEEERHLDHPLFEIFHDGDTSTEQRQQAGGLTIMDLDSELEKDRVAAALTEGTEGRLVPFIFFDFDDTLHHTSTSAKLAYHDRLTGEDMKTLQARLGDEGVHFNPSDPLVHPGLLAFLRRLRSKFGSVLLLSAGSGTQPNGTDTSVEVTLFSNYVRLWSSEFGCSLFDVLGTDPKVLPLNTPFLSPSAFRFCDQLVPPAPQQEAIDTLFACMDAWHAELQSSPGRLNELDFVLPGPSPEIAAMLVRLSSKTSYFYYRGVIPVSGTKRDALLRYLYHVYLADRNAFLASRIGVYFVDDQLRYLKDVEEAKSALILTSLQRESPEFVEFIRSDRFACKTFLMPQFRPKIIA